jgi:hydrogenase/urease accessory protein HupE
MKRFALIAGSAVVAATPAFAHPGHGAPGSSTTQLHYLTTPEHLGPVLIAVLIAAVLFALARRRAR